MSVLEGLFALTIVVTFLFWAVARIRKKSALEMYGEVMDKLFGLGDYDNEEKEASKPFRPFEFKGRKLIKGLRIKEATIHKARGALR